MYRPIAGLALVLSCSFASSLRAAESDTIESLEPAGCIIEPFAAEEGISQYQVNSVSPDGRQIVVAWDRDQQEHGVYLLDIETGARTDLEGLNNSFSFSPDGQYLVGAMYVENGKTDIALYEIATGEKSILALHEEWDWLPSFSPDGKQVVFNSYRNGNSDIFLLDLESGQLDQLTDNESYEAHAQFSPDGDTIVYHEQVSATDFNVNIMNVASGRITTITDEPSEESYPSWSRDGKYIVFASDRDQSPGVNDVFIMTRDGEVIRKITDSSTNDHYPYWSPDGRYIYMNANRDPHGIYRVKMSDQINCERADK